MFRGLMNLESTELVFGNVGNVYKCMKTSNKINLNFDK